MNDVVTKVDRLAVTKSNIEAVYNKFEKVYLLLVRQDAPVVKLYW